MASNTKSKKATKAFKPTGSVETLADAAECLRIIAHPVHLRIVL